MADVFISYLRKDKDFVKALHAALSKQNREAWVDWEDIPLTADWWQEIEQGIETADTFIFVLSSDSVGSPVCNEEIEHAVKNNKRLIPIVRRDDFLVEQVCQPLRVIVETRSRNSLGSYPRDVPATVIPTLALPPVCLLVCPPGKSLKQLILASFSP